MCISDLEECVSLSSLLRLAPLVPRRPVGGAFLVGIDRAAQDQVAAARDHAAVTHRLVPAAAAPGTLGLRAAAEVGMAEIRRPHFAPAFLVKYSSEKVATGSGLPRCLTHGRQGST